MRTSLRVTNGAITMMCAEVNNRPSTVLAKELKSGAPLLLSILFLLRAYAAGLSDWFGSVHLSSVVCPVKKIVILQFIGLND